MAHVLVIGGTGMLADACLSLCAEGYSVSVAARRAEGHSAIKKKLGDKASLLHPIIADYTDTDELLTQVRQAIQRFGSPAAIISWIHSHAQDAHAAIAKLADGEVNYFHIRGSTDPRALAVKSPVQQQLEALKNVRYHQVILGFVIHGGSSRWLTDAEISAGVMRAVKDRLPVFVVGTLEPFSSRP